MSYTPKILDTKPRFIAWFNGEILTFSFTTLNSFHQSKYLGCFCIDLEYVNSKVSDSDAYGVLRKGPTSTEEEKYIEQDEIHWCVVTGNQLPKEFLLQATLEGYL